MNSESKEIMGKPVMVIGGGITGIHASLNLARMNYKVILIETSAALGGAFPYLFRTYPDCACCRIYSKMLEVITHPNIDILTLSEVSDIRGKIGQFHVEVTIRPRYVDLARCVSCGRCADVCPQKVDIRSGFEWGSRKAAYIPYPQAIPYGYAIDDRNCLQLLDGSCQECQKVCPTDALKFAEHERNKVFEVGAIILASGFESTPVSICNKYGYQLPNVITAPEFESLLSPFGPTHGELLCPSNGIPPERIAWIQCVGSRDTRRPDFAHCSSVCCMYAIKEAINARENLGGEVETDIFYMDIRAFGKGYDEYYQAAREEYGVRFRLSRIHQILPSQDLDNLRITYHDQETDQVKDKEYDLIVLSTGMQIPSSVKELEKKLGLATGTSSFIRTSAFNPVETSCPGIFACGSLAGPKDIYDSMIDAGAAAASMADIYALPDKVEEKTPEMPSLEEKPRIGVFLCECPILQLETESFDQIKRMVKDLPNVSLVKSEKTLCTEAGRESIANTAKEANLNRVLVTSCSPGIHRPLLTQALGRQNLRPSMLNIIDLVESQTIPAHKKEIVETDRLKEDIERSVSDASGSLPLPPRMTSVTPSALVVGGGISGLEFAITLADSGFSVHLIEKSERLGGHALEINETWRGEPVKPYMENLTHKATSHPEITIYLNSEVTENKGAAGHFRSVITPLNGGERKEIIHGVTHLATGAKEFKPAEYLYGKDPNVITLMELEKGLNLKDRKLTEISLAVFIQCVGSRERDRPYCSRVCCTRALRCTLKLKELNPKAEICVLHRDVRTYGLREEVYQDALREGVFFIRYDLSTRPSVTYDENGILRVKVEDPVIRKIISIKPDLLVLSTATVPDAREISQIFSVDLDENGFFAESHTKLRPAQFYKEGITMSGMAHGPKFLDESIAQARAAATHAMTILQRNNIMFGGSVAVVDRGLCAACYTCARVCPFDVPVIRDGASTIDETLCQGCGACVAECPAKAISLTRYEDQRISPDCASCHL